MAPNAEWASAGGGRDPEPLKWTVNCLVCHTAEIDGVAYFGAGTKTFDELWLGEALKRLTSDSWRRMLPLASGDDALAADANRILNSHHHDGSTRSHARDRPRSPRRTSSSTCGHTSNRMPRVDEVGRGDVKTPPLWHTAAKMPADGGTRTAVFTVPFR